MSAELTRGFIITFVGIVTVFMVLVVLSYCFAAMKLLSRVEKGPAEDQPAPADESQLAASGDEASGDGPDGVDEDELAAVITAALAAYLGGETVVTAIRRVEDAASWSRTGRHDQMASAL